MGEFRMGRNTTKHFTSFEDLAKAFGVKPVNKQTKDKAKLESQREKFLSRNKCKACGQPMTFNGDNVMVCCNEDCKGIKHEITDEETGTVKVYYTPSFKLLDNKSSEIAKNLFA